MIKLMTPKQRIQLCRDRLFIATNFFESSKIDLWIANKLKSNKRKSIAMTGINLSRGNIRRAVYMLETSMHDYEVAKHRFLTRRKNAERDYLNDVIAKKAA